jgi:carbamoyltransferase
MNILGISAFYHDSAACLVKDGDIVAAAQEERFTRTKHDHRFPVHALDYCLREANLEPRDLDFVAFYEKPFTKFERLLETYIGYAPAGFRSFLAAMPLWLRQKLHIPREMDRGLRGEYKGRYVFLDHHESHAASAFFPSPFEEAAILTVDGVGEWATATMGVGKGNRIQLTHELRFPHSVGLLYSAFTYFAGFRVNSGEYKLMGLAPYGEPRFKNLILERLLDLKEDGSFRMDMSYFNYCQGLTMTGPKFDRLFGGPPRKPESALTQREMDIAASIQAVTDEIMRRMARHVARQTGMANLVLAGGVALNCVANSLILRERIFDRVWIQPAAGDAGGALGAALFVWHQLLDEPRHVDGVHDAQKGSMLGPAYSDTVIRQALDRAGAPYRYYNDEEQLLDTIAEQIAAGKVIGYVDGRMEFGPRALGSRSIIGDARSTDMQSTMNLKIKFRESFRPFAPSVLREFAHEWFTMGTDQESPYMLLVAPVRPDRRVATNTNNAATVSDLDGLLRIRRSEVPAVTHVDFSARVQTVDERHGRFYRLLRRFHERTGCPVIINTSFNVRGEPIVCSPEHAYRCFRATNMDALVLGNFVLLKEAQVVSSLVDADAYKHEFQLD